VKGNHEIFKRLFFKKWQSFTSNKTRLSPMISELKLTILQLQSELELAQSMNNNNNNSPSAEERVGGDGNNNSPGSVPVGAGLLAAERALNK
jgi:hypothetical protein